MREALLTGYDHCRVEGQGGSRPRAPMQSAMGQIRGFLSELHTSKRSGGVLFVDGQTAFYSTIRQFLTGRDGQDTLDQLNVLSEALFASETERLSFVSTALAPGLLEQGSVPLEVRRVMAATLDTTWFGVGGSGEHCFLTRTGTTPGAPLADLAFQYVFATVLSRLGQRLLESDCAAFIGPEFDVRVHAPSWMDDVAFPFATAQATEVIPAASRIVQAVSQEFRRIGIAVNWGRGKTELIPVFHGPQAHKERQRWCTSLEATFLVNPPSSEAVQVQITASYVHLGSVIDITAGDLGDIRRRRTLARELQKPLMRLLCNPFLTSTEKVALFLAMPVARFRHGSGLWKLSSQKERSQFHASYMELVRRTFRPVTGVSSRGLQDEEVCDGLGVLSSSELRTVELTRTTAWLLLELNEAINVLWFSKGDWFAEAHQAVVRCAAASGISANDAWPSLRAHPGQAKAWVRRFTKQCIKPRAARGAVLIPQWRQLDRARAEGWIFCKFEAAPKAQVRLQECTLCKATFATPAALAAHMSKRHQRRAKAAQVAFGSRCESCCKEFWNTSRLVLHLRKSPVCLRVLEEADLPKDALVPAKHTFAWPPAAATFGPRPFWATLRPCATAEPDIAVQRQIVWPAVPDLSKGVCSKGLDGFVKAFVELGIRENLSAEDVPLHLLRLPFCLKGLIECCVDLFEMIPARSAGSATHHRWCFSCCEGKAILRPAAARQLSDLPPLWAGCLQQA